MVVENSTWEVSRLLRPEHPGEGKPLHGGREGVRRQRKAAQCSAISGWVQNSTVGALRHIRAERPGEGKGMWGNKVGVRRQSRAERSAVAKGTWGMRGSLRPG